MMTATLAGAGEDCLGVMGGIGGRYLLDEYGAGPAARCPPAR